MKSSLLSRKLFLGRHIAMTQQHLHDVIIIGTGPAGHTAALYAARAALKPLVFEGIQPGGQLTTTTEVENFPGFPEGITGPELMENMHKQAARFGAEYVQRTIVKANLKSSPFSVTDDNGQTYHCKTVIISTGASAKYLGLPHEMELIGRGVSACATCDGFFYKNKIVHVVGGGDTAMEEAMFLSKFASEVILLHRRDSFRASKPMIDRVLQNEKIKIIYNTTVTEILHDASGVHGIRVKNVVTNETSERKTDGLFMAIGHTPNTSFLEGAIDCDHHGFIKTELGVCTNIPGVFACGDVQDSYYRQAITAAGSGCQAAIRVERYLSESHTPT
jgi:thioredoxin reductase (NADPH)